MVKRFLPLLVLTIYGAAVTIGVFNGGAWGALGIGGAALFFVGTWVASHKLPLPAQFPTVLAITTLGFFALELPLSSRLDLSLHVWGQLVSIFVPLLLLTSKPVQAAALSQCFVPVIAVAMACGALALGMELSSGGYLLHHLKKPTTSLTEYNRGIAQLVILAFPVLAGLWGLGKRNEAFALAALILFPACLTESHTAKLALIVGAFCVVAALYRPLWVQSGLALGAAFMVSFPFYVQRFFAFHYDAVESWHDSWRHRMEIWDYLSYRIMDRPVFGWGLGTTHTLDFTLPHGGLYQIVHEGAPHAHNFMVQTWVETGIAGLAFALVFLFYTLWRAYRLHPSLRPFAMGCWAAAVVVCLFGFDFWTDALWASFALSAFAFGMLQQQIERRQNLSAV